MADDEPIEDPVKLFEVEDNNIIMDSVLKEFDLCFSKHAFYNSLELLNPRYFGVIDTAELKQN